MFCATGFVGESRNVLLSGLVEWQSLFSGKQPFIDKSCWVLTGKLLFAPRKDFLSRLFEERKATTSNAPIIQRTIPIPCLACTCPDNLVKLDWDLENKGLRILLHRSNRFSTLPGNLPINSLKRISAL